MINLEQASLDLNGLFLIFSLFWWDVVHTYICIKKEEQIRMYSNLCALPGMFRLYLASF